nr:DUF397 domain-containing protein [Amycolatopsis arida]
MRKSSQSDGAENCVEVAGVPDPRSVRKPSHSDSGEACVEVGRATGQWAVRDGKLGDASPLLVLSEPSFVALLDHLR